MSNSATIFWLLVLLFVYFIPSFAAANKKGDWGVFVVNLFLGWTLVGWVVALAWAVSSPRKDAPASPSSAIGPSGELLTAIAGSDTKRCPFCAEDIKRDAIVCKHCGRDLPRSDIAGTPAETE